MQRRLGSFNIFIILFTLRVELVRGGKGHSALQKIIINGEETHLTRNTASTAAAAAASRGAVAASAATTCVI